MEKLSDDEIEIDLIKITNWINNPEFNQVDFYKLRDYAIKELDFNGNSYTRNWPYGISYILVENNFVKEAQKFQLKLFNNVENLVDIYSKVDKYVLTQEQSKNLSYNNNGFIVLHYLAKTRGKFDSLFFFRNINITQRYTISFCSRDNIDDYIALGNFSKNTGEDWFYKMEFFNNGQIVKKNKFSITLKNMKNVYLFIFWNGTSLDMSLLYNGSDKKVERDIQKINNSVIVRIFNNYGDLYDMRVENYRKLLPETGELYKEYEQDFEVLKTNMCI